MIKITSVFFAFSFFCTQVFSQTTVGLLKENTAEDGYVLFAPIRSDTTYLIDKCGRLIHQWGSNHTPGMSEYLLADGSLLRSASIPNRNIRGNGSQGGMIQKYDWAGNLLWQDTINAPTYTQNHDIYPMPNGNILAVIWIEIDSTVQMAHGRKPSLTLGNIWSVRIQEIQPIGTNGGTVVWQWDLIDHVIQDYDSTKLNYGVVADHPELVNINYVDSLQKDWTHGNAVIYNPAIDQIIVSSHNLSEIWMVDHSTTTAQAAAHTGGAHGHGGDLLYRWGNPQVYNRGTSANRVFYTQHNPNWIPTGYPHAGSIIIFNNGQGRPGGNASSVDIFTPPMDSNGNYALTAGQPYAPTSTAWSYQATVPASFYSNVMGSAQPLASGNVVVCQASQGIFFEIDSNKNIRWKYQSPVSDNAAVAQGSAIINAGIFRCTQYDASYAAFTGRTLTPMGHIEGNAILTHCDSIGLTTGISGISDEAEIMVYPNPADDKLTVIFPNQVDSFSYQMYDLIGQKIIEGQASRKESLLDISELRVGVYILKIESNNYHPQKRIIVTHLKTD